jgi:cytidylate kinase
MVIAISGQPGSGAREIGQRISKALGCDHYDRLVLEGVARRLGATVEAVEARERRPLTWLERAQRLVERAFAQGAFSGWAADPYYLPPSAVELLPVDEAERGPKTQPYEIGDQEYAEALRAELKEIASRGDLVVVHPAACAAIAANPEVFRVGVFAPEATRVTNLQTIRGLVEVEPTRRELAERDRARESILGNLFHVRPDDPSMFDMTVNTGTLPIEDAAQQVLDAVRTRIERRRGDALIGTSARRAGDARSPAEVTTREAPAVGEQIVKALAMVDIFNALPESLVREIATLGTLVKMPEGAVLASEESVGEAVYAVLDGQVELSADSEVGRITVRIAHAGETFPLAAIIGTGRIITRAEAMTDLELWRIDRAAFQSFLKSRPEIGLPVYDAAARIMADRYRHTLARLTRATERALEQSRPRVSV